MAIPLHWSAVPASKIFRVSFKIGIICIERKEKKKYPELKKYIPPTAGFIGGTGVGLMTHDYYGISRVGLKYLAELGIIGIVLNYLKDPMVQKISGALDFDINRIENHLGKWILTTGERIDINQISSKLNITSGIAILDAFINDRLQSMLKGDDYIKEIACVFLDEFRFSSWDDLLLSLFN